MNKPAHLQQSAASPAVLENVKGILFDLDGVLYVGSQVIDGAREAVDQIRRRGIACRFITNTSTQSLASLSAKLQGLGFAAQREDIISAPQAAVLYLRKQRHPVCRLLLAENVRQDFAEFAQSDTHPTHIVIGDIGEAWHYRLLDSVFNQLMNGAKLIAIHKNRFWQTETGLRMDIGGFVRALEYASGAKAMVIGKPAREFFQMALDAMRLPADAAIVVGDDIDSDVGGAQLAGMRGILVRTGKFRKAYAAASTISPEIILDSVADLPNWVASGAKSRSE